MSCTKGHNSLRFNTNFKEKYLQFIGHDDFCLRQGLFDIWFLKLE
jgi:hypothetical protein